MNLTRFSDPLDLVWFWNIVFPMRKRTLYPTLRDSFHSDEDKTHINLLITVIGARNIPTRSASIQKHQSLSIAPHKEYSSDNQNQGSLRDVAFLDDRDGNVNTFVQVVFQDTVYLTRSVAGSTPQWQHTFEIPLSLNNNSSISPKNLIDARDKLEISLFDSLQEDIGKGGGYYKDENTLVQERRFLGHLSLPLTVLLSERNIRGAFPLTSPYLVLGYHNMTKAGAGQSRESILSRSKQISEDSSEASGQKTYLSMLMTTDPKISKTDRCETPCPSIEDQSVMRYAKSWVDQFYSKRSLFSQISHRIIVPDTSGYEWLVTRFLKSQAPPVGFDNSMQSCAYFVSLIPFLDNWQAFKGQIDMWFTSQQFLNILAGNWEEHAVLLANFFMYISDHSPEKHGMDVSLVLGSSIHQGKVVSCYSVGILFNLKIYMISHGNVSETIVSIFACSDLCLN